MVDAALIGEPPLHMYSRNTCTILHVPECPQLVEILRPKGDVLLRPAEEMPKWIGKPRKFWGILGVVELAHTRCLLLVETCTLVGSLLNSHIFRVDSLCYHALVDKNLQDLSDRDKTLIAMLDTLVRDRSFYFSFDLDLTRSVQGQLRARAGLNYTEQPGNSEPRFRFNQQMMRLFGECASPLHEAYDLKVIYGFVYLRPVSLRDARIDFALISKKDVRKLGRRFLSRGLDPDGNVSNFVETEQLVAVSGLEAGPLSISSYLQIRGSIPLFWRQKISTAWMPKTELVKHRDCSADETGRKHIEESMASYGDLALVNLINKKGKEGRLGDQFTAFVDELGSSRVRYEWFDFHKECAKMQWQNLSKLVEALQDKLDSYGFFQAQIDSSALQLSRVSKDSIKILSQQTGAVRTNCMDCLDRTNVVQSVLARQILHSYLSGLKMVPPQGANPFEQFPEALEQIFREGWTCNANALSKLYTGTPALKTDFTLTGKRTIAGALQDGKNSLHRYYLNNFKDGYFQDCLEFSQGQLAVNGAGENKLKFRKPPSHGSQLLFCLILLLGGLFMARVGAAWAVGDSAGVGGVVKGYVAQGVALLGALLVLGKTIQLNLKRQLNLPTRRKLL